MKGRWEEIFEEENQKKYFVDLLSFVDEERANEIVYPPQSLVFNSFELCPFEKVKVIIIGQDPYHGQGQANGLSFSVNDGVKFPPSLRNIFKEYKEDLSKEIPFSGNLERWAKQGVLLLNATLTVRAKEAGSHQKQGWEEFTDEIISRLNQEKEGLAFVLWGAYAQKKGLKIDSEKHFVLKSVHPSPFSARNGFFGSKPFSKVNEYLETKGINKIDW